MIDLSENRVPLAPKFDQNARVAGKTEMQELVKYGRQLQKCLETLQSAIIDLQQRIAKLES